MRPLLKVRRAGCLVGLLFLLALSYSFRSPVHYSDDIRFRVIDEQTGMPLPGTAVLAIWWTHVAVVEENTRVFYRAQAFADLNGVVTVPGMPPRLRKPFHYFKWWDPVLIIYKPGYMPARADNIGFGERDYLGPWDKYGMKRRSFWHGKTIPLAPAKTKQDEWESLRFCLDQTYVGESTPFPPEFTKFWEVLAEGYRRLPDVMQSQEMNPQDVIDRRTGKTAR